MTEPDDATALLQRIDQRLARLERLADRLERLETQGLAAAAVVTDTVDRALNQASNRGIEVDPRTRALASVVLRATEPAALHQLESGLELMAAAPGALAALTDTLDGLAAQLIAAGIDPDARVRNLVSAAERLTSNEAIEVLHSVLDRLTSVRTLLASGILDPASTEVVGRMARALAHAAEEPPGRVGPFGALKALADPDVGRTVDFLLRFARGFGRVAHHHPSPALPAQTRKD